jgi:hypothetical protein
VLLLLLASLLLLMLLLMLELLLSLCVEVFWPQGCAGNAWQRSNATAEWRRPFRAPAEWRRASSRPWAWSVEEAVEECVS